MSNVRDPDAIVRELTEGRGYVVLEGVFDRETVIEAKGRLIELVALGTAKRGRTVPAHLFRPQDQVYNLIDKGRVFERMAEEPTALAVFSRILGSELMLGSLAARIVSRESDPQPPHLDRETVIEAKGRLIELVALGTAKRGRTVPAHLFRPQDQVYNLIDKGRVFERMAEEPTALAVFSRILGSELMLGSLAARIVSRESDPQPPHLDRRDTHIGTSTSKRRFRWGSMAASS